MIIKVTIPHQIQLKVAPKFKSMFFSKKGEIHYIGGAEILPPPLNAEEESRAIMGLETEQEQQARSKLSEKIRQHRSRSGGPDLHRHHRPDQGHQYI